MTLKKEIALRSGNSGKANAKKVKSILAHQKTSVNEILGGIIWTFGAIGMFGQWADNTTQIIGWAVAIGLMLIGTVVMLGGKE